MIICVKPLTSGTVERSPFEVSLFLSGPGKFWAFRPGEVRTGVGGFLLTPDAWITFFQLSGALTHGPLSTFSLRVSPDSPSP